jgi:hypothetical protein
MVEEYSCRISEASIFDIYIASRNPFKGGTFYGSITALDSLELEQLERLLIPRIWHTLQENKVGFGKNS